LRSCFSSSKIIWFLELKSLIVHVVRLIVIMSVNIITHKMLDIRWRDSIFLKRKRRIKWILWEGKSFGTIMNSQLVLKLNACKTILIDSEYFIYILFCSIWHYSLEKQRNENPRRNAKLFVVWFGKKKHIIDSFVVWFGLKRRQPRPYLQSVSPPIVAAFIYNHRS
jgi:hypothetical protein